MLVRVWTVLILVLIVSIVALVALAGCDTILAGDLDATHGGPMADAAPPFDQTAVSEATILDQTTVPDRAASDHAEVADFTVPSPALGKWITIPAGTFMMGSPPTDPCRHPDETQHQVTLTHAFEIAAHEVTQGEFQALMGYNPSYFASCGTSCPVERVRWYEAAAYCNALSAQKGLAQCYACTGSGTSVTCSEASAYSGQKVYTCPGYRLPTEAEWEYAYRAGTTTAYHSGPNDPDGCGCSPVDANLDKIGWYCGNEGSTTHPVGQKQANAWGLFDMAGNVYELCHDRHQNVLGSSAVTDPFGAVSGSTRVFKGGSWGANAKSTRAASRLVAVVPTTTATYVGFRCTRSQ